MYRVLSKSQKVRATNSSLVVGGSNPPRGSSVHINRFRSIRCSNTKNTNMSNKLLTKVLIAVIMLCIALIWTLLLSTNDRVAIEGWVITSLLTIGAAAICYLLWPTTQRLKEQEQFNREFYSKLYGTMDTFKSCSPIDSQLKSKG